MRSAQNYRPCGLELVGIFGCSVAVLSHIAQLVKNIDRKEVAVVPGSFPTCRKVVLLVLVFVRFPFLRLR